MGDRGGAHTSTTSLERRSSYRLLYSTSSPASSLFPSVIHETWTQSSCSSVPSIGLMKPNPRSFHRQTTPLSHPPLVPPPRLPPRGDRDRRRRAGERERDRRRRAGDRDRDRRRWGDLDRDFFRRAGDLDRDLARSRFGDVDRDLARSRFGDAERDLDREPRSPELVFAPSVAFGDPACSTFSGSGDGISCEL